MDGVSEGTKAIGAADIDERYDPKRYAGKVPPHVCSIASSTAIAQQIPGAPYVFERAVPNGGDFGWKVTSTGSSVERVFPVTTPMGKKNIPVQMVHIEGQPNRVILTCPYTGQHFAFQQKSTMGAGRPLGAGDAISTAASAQATLQNTQNLPSNLQQQFTDGVAQQQSSGEANAITAMIGLLEKGSFDPDSPADMQAVIDITAGALTACGLPEIAAALELLDAGAHAFASLMVQLGVFKLATGWSNGGKTWTAGDILQAWGWPVAQGSTVKSSGIFGITATSPGPTAFAQVAVPVFAKYAADAINAKPTPPFSLISEALVKLWNAASGGSTTLVFVPGFFAAGEAALGVPMVAGYGANDVFPLEIAFAYAPQGALPSPWISSLSDDSFMSYTALSTGTPKQQSLPIHAQGPPVQNGKGGDTPAASKGLAVAGLLVAGAAVAAGVGIWGMSQGLGYGAAWKALGSKLAAQTTASGNLLLGARVPMLAAEKSRSRRARRRA